jgi:hypothetical protein
LLKKYNLRKINIVYVKDESFNFNAMTNALKSMVGCEFIGLEESL